MSRSILLSIMFIAGTLGVIAFSAAQFTDFESATAPLEAGTIDLVIDDSAATTTLTCTFPADGLEGRLRIGGTPQDANPYIETTPETQINCPFELTHVGSLEHADLYAEIGITATACGTTPPEFCDGDADLQATQFLVVEADMGTPSVSSPPVELSAYLTDCTLLDGEMPVGGTPWPGSLVVELQQDRTSNVMQGDTITIEVRFELAEDGAPAATINCEADTSDVITP